MIVSTRKALGRLVVWDEQKVEGVEAEEEEEEEAEVRERAGRRLLRVPNLGSGSMELTGLGGS